ncbi:unnamed protein product, partial [Trichogramma brassicae]
MFSRSFLVFFGVVALFALAVAAVPVIDDEEEISLEIDMNELDDVESKSLLAVALKVLTAAFKWAVKHCLKEAAQNCKQHWKHPKALISCASRENRAHKIRRSTSAVGSIFAGCCRAHHYTRSRSSRLLRGKSKPILRSCTMVSHMNVIFVGRHTQTRSAGLRDYYIFFFLHACTYRDQVQRLHRHAPRAMPPWVRLAAAHVFLLKTCAGLQQLLQWKIQCRSCNSQQQQQAVRPLLFELRIAALTRLAPRYVKHFRLGLMPPRQNCSRVPTHTYIYNIYICI